ncbi:hypothetical protein FGRMN_9457 [Fusarium graminum]|nr:hypothetical protein FGRMN_9457 [Fusarium graminum]
MKSGIGSGMMIGANSPQALSVLALFFSILLLGWAHKRSQPALPLPPGPPSEFLLGHARVMPKENASAVYAKWSRDYNIIHLRSLGRSTVVLNSAEVARDILDKKGANFCDRPRFTLLEITVRNLIKNPKSWETSLRRFAVAVVLQVSYGAEVLEDDDPYIQIVNDAMYATGNGGVPANSLVDLVPSARYLPDWIVRDRSLQFARKWRWAIQKLHEVPFAAAQSEHV